MSNFENTLHAWRSRQHESATIGPAGLLILGKNDENECWIQLFGKGNLFFSYFICIYIYAYIYFFMSCLDDVLFTKPKTVPKCRREDPTCCPGDGV